MRPLTCCSFQLALQARAAEEDASTSDPLSAACQAELDAFKQDASTNINKNVRLGAYCIRCSFRCLGCGLSCFSSRFPVLAVCSCNGA